jgi:hypothetical protein
LFSRTKTKTRLKVEENFSFKSKQNLMVYEISFYVCLKNW